MTLLAFETSCDESSAAVVQNGQILSNVVSSQVQLHAEYGGVVPELAAREHLRNLIPAARTALHQAGTTSDQIEAVAATQGPGVPGAVMAGFQLAATAGLPPRRPHLGVQHTQRH